MAYSLRITESQEKQLSHKMRGWDRLALLMNPRTGSVDIWENWLSDQDIIGFPMSDLNNLIEVDEDEDGNWVEL